MKKAKWLVLILVVAVAAFLTVRISQRQRRSAYEEAMELYDSGRYGEAAQTFEELDNYRDSEDMFLEAENMEKYAQAQELFDSGAYRDAAELYASLGSFRDSADMAREAGRAASYYEGLELLDAGDMEGALRAFEDAEDYLDAAGLAADTSNAIMYARALELAQSGDYEEARRILLDLGDYSDAADMAEEIELYSRYMAAVDLMEGGDYSGAEDMFDSLDGYRDSAELAEYSREMPRILQDYALAESYSAQNTYEGLCRAGELLYGIWEYGYGDTEIFMSDIDLKVMAPINESLEAGDLQSARTMLKTVQGYAPNYGEYLWDSVVRRESFDYAYYDDVLMDYPHMTSFTADTPAIEYVKVYIYMYLNGIGTLEMEPAPGAEVPQSYGDDFLRGMIDTYWPLIDSVMGETCGAYGHMINWWYRDGRTTKIQFNIIPENSGYTEEDLKRHLEEYDDFCRRSLEVMTENLMIGTSMSYRQRAEVIYDWVIYWLTYDQSLETHDPGLAVETRIGVCECYTALYNRMCCYAGVPTFAQNGVTGEYIGQDDPEETHIWSIQLDEQGNIFYTDSTWADSFEAGFRNDSLASTVLDFDGIRQGTGSNAEEVRLWAANSDFRAKYFWKSSLFSDHQEFFKFPYEISLWDATGGAIPGLN